MLFSGIKLGSLTDQEKDFLGTAYEKALIAVKKNITPMNYFSYNYAQNHLVVFFCIVFLVMKSVMPYILRVVARLDLQN